MAQSDESNNTENPYAAPLSSSAIEHAAEDQDPQTQDLRTFVGPRADYYLSKWPSLLEGGGTGAGANWAAFFLSGLWLPYRKMYKVAAVFYGVIMLESLAEEALFVGLLGQPETPAIISRIAGLVAAVICAGYGNRWYLAHARKVIAEVGSEGVDREARLQMIARRGGTSLIASMGCFILYIAALIAVFTALDLFGGA